jgi:hypothetical protein
MPDTICSFKTIKYLTDYIKPTDAQLKTTFYCSFYKIFVQTFYKSYNKKWFLIVHQLV